MKLFKRLLKYLSILLIIITIIVVSIIHIFGNFYQIDNDVYRSGQLNKYNLPYYIEHKHIKTILNLRGKSNGEFYKIETNISNKYGVTHIDYGFSNKDFLDFNKTSEIVSIIKNAKKPLLIHCAGGADRTSLAAALYQYAIAHKSPKIAKEQFSVIYGHSPYFRPYVEAMDRSFDNYVKKSQGK